MLAVWAGSDVAFPIIANSSCFLNLVKSSYNYELLAVLRIANHKIILDSWPIILSFLKCSNITIIIIVVQLIEIESKVSACSDQVNLI